MISEAVAKYVVTHTLGILIRPGESVAPLKMELVADSRAAGRPFPLAVEPFLHSIEYILDRMKERLDGEWKWSARGARIRDKLHLEWGDRFAWPDKDAECMGDDVFCYGLGDHFGILSDGRIVPCCLDADGEITLGNAFEDKIEDVIASDRAKSIRDGFKTRHAPEPLCQRCGYARRFK